MFNEKALKEVYTDYIVDRMKPIADKMEKENRRAFAWGKDYYGERITPSYIFIDRDDEDDETGLMVTNIVFGLIPEGSYEDPPYPTSYDTKLFFEVIGNESEVVDLWVK